MPQLARCVAHGCKALIHRGDGRIKYLTVVDVVKSGNDDVLGNAVTVCVKSHTGLHRKPVVRAYESIGQVAPRLAVIGYIPCHCGIFPFGIYDILKIFDPVLFRKVIAHSHKAGL